MNHEHTDCKSHSRIAPLTALGVILLGSGVYVAYLVLSELWNFYQTGENAFLAVIMDKLGDDQFLLFDNAPVVLGVSAKYVIGTVIFLVLAAVFSGVATSLISSGSNLLSPEVRDLKERFVRLKKRVEEKGGTSNDL